MWVFLWVACEPVVPGSPSGGSGTVPIGGAARADVVNVATTGDPGAYTFGVTLRSDDIGCEQYANWWEVLTPDGGLVYRRILTHSHPDEQPFTRTGGPVDVAAETEVVVRGHLQHAGQGDGYGGTLLRGTVGGGFSAWEPPDGWAADVVDDAPQPDGCLF